MSGSIRLCHAEGWRGGEGMGVGVCMGCEWGAGGGGVIRWGLVKPSQVKSS